MQQASQTNSVEVEAEPLTLHQLTNLFTDLIQQGGTHFGMALDLIDEILHISSRHAMAADSRLHLAAKRLQQCNLIVGQGLGAGVVDVHGDSKKRG